MTYARADLTAPFAAKVPRSIGAGCDAFAGSSPAAWIQRAVQSPGFSRPISHEAGALQAEALPAPSHTRTRQP